MKKKILSLLLLCAATANAQTWIGKADDRAPAPSIAVDIRAPGAVRAEVGISVPSLEEVQRHELHASQGTLVGGIPLRAGEKASVRITTFDARGEKLHHGAGHLVVDKGITPQIDIPLEGPKGAASAKLGSHRLGLTLEAGPDDKGVLLKATLFDASGTPVSFEPEKIRWEGWPEGFEWLKYSCFRESLCIELPERPRLHELLACIDMLACSHPDPPDTRGPYRYVATGRHHSCALTIDNEIRCWGDNRYGQLRSTPTTCPAGTSTWPSDCSPVPLPIQCGTGEACRFQSLAAGGERTCAVDTDGRLWCWGSYPDPYTDEPVQLSYADRFNGEVEAFKADGTKVSFIAVDTDLRHSCAISSARAVYCWEFNESLLEDQHIHSPGTLYQSVSVGKRHVCARQVSGKFECWGDNFDGQLNGSHTGSSGQLHPGLKEILTRGGHRPAAGSTSSCAQDPDDNTICWGSPSHWVGSSAATGGWMALRHSYATSIASNTDACPVSGGTAACTRICATGLGGDLFCGHWKSWAAPTQLPLVPPPASDHYISWTQADVGPNHVCAVNTQRDIWCFGTNRFGQLGTGATSTSRTDIPSTPVLP